MPVAPCDLTVDDEAITVVVYCRRLAPGQENKSQKGYISPIWGEAPTQAIYIKNCLVADVVDVITCAKFQNEIYFHVLRFYKGRSFHFPIDF